MKEWKIIVEEKSSEAQKKLNQWENLYKIEIIQMCEFAGKLTILLNREKL